MTDFSATTPFGLVRRLAAAGQDSPSIYMLICEASSAKTVRAEIAAELQVQLGVNLRSLAVSDLLPEKLEEAFAGEAVSLVVLITFDHWAPKLIASLDRNVVLMTRGGPVLLLAGLELARRVLVAAPNLRNRLIDVLAIKPDEAFGDARA